MAAFHFTAKIHSRSGGRNAVRAAAYRASERLQNERERCVEDYTRKADVIEAAILAPVGSAAWAYEREQLWNVVEARENRRDAQVAQELEINLPRELSDEENWRLITDFTREHLVSHGRICDVAMHRHTASDGETHPHAHVLMPTRSLAEKAFENGLPVSDWATITDPGERHHKLRHFAGDVFGDKHPDCSWRTFTKRRDRLVELREVWCDFARRRALELGIDLGHGWDHRSFEDRGIDLEAQPKLGGKANRLRDEGTPAERTDELLAAQRRNGAQLLINPAIALEALTARHATFTHADLARYVFSHSAADQYEAALAKALALVVPVGRDERGLERYSSAAQIALEARMIENAVAMASTPGHAVRPSERKLLRSGLSPEQRDAAAQLLEGGDLSCLVGYAGAGKSTMLSEVRAELAAAGYNVRGAALSGIAAQNLTDGSGIEARTLASLRYGWNDGSDELTARDVLVIDEAGMIGSRELAGVLENAKTAGAKVILVGDPEQLQAIESGAAFRAVAERTGYAELTEIRRQQTDWQRTATRELATNRTADAVARYMAAGAVETAYSDDDAKALLVQRWQDARAASPGASRIMLAHSRRDVQALNDCARAALRADGQLGEEREIETNRGTRAFATGDRLLFLRNERNLGVKNGTLGIVSGMADGKLTVRTDDGRMVAVDPLAYRDLDHGYAVTVHKSQGVTVDEAYVLASRGFDRHLTYVAASRHRSKLAMVWSQESFGSENHLLGVLGRERAKDTTLDYREADAHDLAELATATVWVPDIPAPALRSTRDFIDAHRSRKGRDQDEIEDAFETWGGRPQQPAREPDGLGADDIEDMWKQFGEADETPERRRERERNRDRRLER